MRQQQHIGNNIQKSRRDSINTIVWHIQGVNNQLTDYWLLFSFMTVDSLQWRILCDTIYA